ncbi:MAG: hypothetical protein K9H26_17830 [Prolixibacteraceae bacterium]|nr:hypothetical protein [Prolixibacteraceae bacterium]
MDIGTGKNLDDYIVDGHTVPYRLIDIVDAGYEYKFITRYLVRARKPINIIISTC